MGAAYKNFWGLNADEAIVSGIIKSEAEKNAEVLMPMNAQMKGVDLVLMNVDTKKAVTIQVKGSRAYEPNNKDLRDYGHGNSSWFFFGGKNYI